MAPPFRKRRRLGASTTCRPPAVPSLPSAPARSRVRLSERVRESPRPRPDAVGAAAPRQAARSARARVRRPPAQTRRAKRGHDSSSPRTQSSRLSWRFHGRPRGGVVLERLSAGTPPWAAVRRPQRDRESHEQLAPRVRALRALAPRWISSEARRTSRAPKAVPDLPEIRIVSWGCRRTHPEDAKARAPEPLPASPS